MAVNDGGLLEVVANLRQKLQQREEQIAELLPYKQCLEEIIDVIMNDPSAAEEFIAGIQDVLPDFNLPSNC